MSIVTDSATTRVIFCEGTPSSPDIALWQRILIGESHKAAKYKCEIRPMGGKQAAKNFAAGYALGTGSTNYRILRDRDLDAEPKLTVIQWDETILTGATCIESYFLLPDLLRDFLADHNLVNQQPTGDHEQTLYEALNALRDYQSVRWALQSVRSQIANHAKNALLYRLPRTFDLPNRLTDEDGKLPATLEFEDCKQLAVALLGRFRDIFNMVNLDELTTEIDKYRSQFDGDIFRQRDFRNWFHGKDVLKFWLRKYINVDHDQFCRWSAYNLNWKSYSDLVEIQRLCQTD